MAPDDPDQWRPWLALLRAPGVGPTTFARLLERFGDPAGVLGAPRPELERAGLGGPAIDWLRAPDPTTLDGDLAWLATPGNHLLRLGDPDYPPLLMEIPDPPPLLFARGDPGLLAHPQLAVVGSRNPTQGGARTAWEFAKYLAGRGLIITSGLALGVDAAAHEGALEGGPSIAVSATGLDRVYPPQHRELAHRIAAQGVLVSEFPPGTPVRRQHFPRRNRLISGLALGTLVVEAAARSGSLITARLAGEQGREVFAIPGSIHNPLARGCHQLIRQGAKLVETAQDILEELGPLLGRLAEVQGSPPIPLATPAPRLDADYQALLDCLGHDPLAMDELMQCSGLGADVVSSMLLLLELEGYVTLAPGGRYCRTPKARTAAGS